MGDFKPRSCLVCQQPCMTEGQLCQDCAAAGHRVTDTEVIVNIGINLPDWMTTTPAAQPALGTTGDEGEDRG